MHGKPSRSALPCWFNQSKWPLNASNGFDNDPFKEYFEIVRSNSIGGGGAKCMHQDATLKYLCKF